MTNPIRQILEGLKISLRQQTVPPYTESNRPQGVFFIDGLDATETALNAYVEERYEEGMMRAHNLAWQLGARNVADAILSDLVNRDELSQLAVLKENKTDE